MAATGPSDIRLLVFGIFKSFHIEAAHWMPNLPEGHKRARLHGHSFEVEIHVAGKLKPEGWVMDFADIKAAFQPLYDQHDHNCLNHIEGLENPTPERLAEWIWIRLRPHLENLCGVAVKETFTTGCLYRGL